MPRLLFGRAFEALLNCRARFDDCHELAIHQAHQTSRLVWRQLAEASRRRAQAGDVRRGDSDLAAIGAVQYQKREREEEWRHLQRGFLFPLDPGEVFVRPHPA